MTLGGYQRPSWAEIYPETTWLRLEQHVTLLRKWNGAINLVAAASVPEAWTRHVLDSMQIFDLRGMGCGHWVDVGSGAGFPGMVVALLAKDVAPEMRVSLVESDRRKAEFLRSVSRETGVSVIVHDARIETLPPLEANVISARALAPLSVLCGYADRHLSKGGRALFLKGARAQEEVLAARKDWEFSLDAMPSRTDPQASVLVLKDLRHV